MKKEFDYKEFFCFVLFCFSHVFIVANHLTQCSSTQSEGNLPVTGSWKKWKLYLMFWMFLVSAQRTGYCVYHLSWTAWGTSDVIWIRCWRPVTWGIRAAGSMKLYREVMEGANNVRYSDSIEMEAKCYRGWVFCCSVAKSWSTLCNPMDCSMPGSSILHYPTEFAQTHVHWVGVASQPSNP